MEVLREISLGEIEKLDDFLRENFPGEPGDKTPVDAAIHIISVLQSRIQKAKVSLKGYGVEKSGPIVCGVNCGCLNSCSD